VTDSSLPATRAPRSRSALRRLAANLTVRVLVAIAAGILLGVVAPRVGAAMKPLGDTFINLVRMVIAPIVFVTVVLGIASMQDIKKVGRVGGKAFLYFEVVTTFALAIGLVSGLFVTRLAIPSFLVTLGMLLVVRGTALWLTNGFPQRTWDAGEQWLARVLVGEICMGGQGVGCAGGLRIYMSLIWFVLLAVAFHYLLTGTRFGNWVQATGGNPGAARNRGVKIGRVKITLFMLSALMAAFAGAISSIRVSAANPNSGTGYELEVIAMVVIGGTALTGGRGTIIGTVIGIFILRIMRNGIVMIGVPGLAYNIFIGAIILGMMALHSGLERRHNPGT